MAMRKLVLRAVTIGINLVALGVLVQRPHPEGPHAFGSGYGVGLPRAAETINGPDRPGDLRMSSVGTPRNR